MTAPSASAAALFSLAGRTALVTGASGGLGARFARVLAGRGARAALGARRVDRLEALAGEIDAAGGAAFAVALDVTDGASIKAAFDAAEARFGTVDLVVNNAGTAVSGLALDTSMDDWREVMAVNLDAVFEVASEAGRRMVAAGVGGAIVNIASVLAFEARKGVAAYAASKAGVVELTRALALELARHGIRVNALAPGYFETELTRDYLETDAGQRMVRQLPQKRTGEVAELDGPLLLLASDAGRYMTGQTILVDGGHSLCMP